MAERKMRGADDDAPKDEVLVGSIVKRRVVDEADDPFLQKTSILRKMEGVSPANKRKAARLEKAHQSADAEAGSKKIEEQQFYGTGYALFDVVLPPYNLEYLAKLNEISSAHYAAVKAKVANIVALGWEFVETDATHRMLEKIDSDEKTRKKRLRLAELKSEMSDWLDSTNEDDEFTETLIKVWTDYETTGNGYLEVGRTVTGEIKYIGHIPAVSMRIRRKRDGFVQMIGNRAVFFRNFGSNTADPVGDDPRPNEVIHIKKYSPTNNFYGIPDIVAAKLAVAGNEFSAQFNLDYFENKAVPRYVVVVKGGNLSAGAQRNILEFFENDLKGKNHRTLFVPLPAETESTGKVSFEMKPVEAGTQDASFMNYDRSNLRNILMAERVPVTKVTHDQGISLAAARDADKTFKEQVCRPEQKIFEKKLNKIIKERTDVFKLKLNELTLTDEDTLSKIDERYLRYGVIVPNEVRARWGWTGLKTGDKGVGIMEQQEAAAEATASQAAAQAKAQANQTRTRDADRSAAASDSAGEARQAQGDGRAQA